MGGGRWAVRSRRRTTVGRAILEIRIRGASDLKGKAAEVMFDREAARMQFSQAKSIKKMLETRSSGFKSRRPGQ